MRTELLSEITVANLFIAARMADLLPEHGACLLHASFVLHEGKAILFSAPGGTGKSTQAHFWERERGSTEPLYGRGSRHPDPALPRAVHVSRADRDIVPTEASDPAEDCTDGQGERMRCRAGKTNFRVTWDGRMPPCGMFPTQGYDLRRMDFAEAREATRRDTAAILLPSACREGALREQCPLCAAACLSETGRTDFRPEYVCRMTHEPAEAIRKKYPPKENHHEGE